MSHLLLKNSRNKLLKSLRLFSFVLLCIHERHNKPVNTLVSQHPYFAFRIHFPSFSNHHSLQLCCFVRSGSHVTMATDKHPARKMSAAGGRDAFRPSSKFSSFFFLYVTQKLEHKKLPAGCPWFAKKLRTSWAEFCWNFNQTLLLATQSMCHWLVNSNLLLRSVHRRSSQHVDCSSRLETKALSFLFLSMFQLSVRYFYTHILTFLWDAVGVSWGCYLSRFSCCYPAGSSALRLTGRPAEHGEDHRRGRITTRRKTFKRCDCLNFGPRVLADLSKVQIIKSVLWRQRKRWGD